ncbi:hypothetical protein [Reichenbachiella agariperforans]|uniref:hypothetical protein n=1 Tax=Reichenbachiella agariperforans TaxID=156994 RepID=UPI001C08D75E|nr:hypothetical protein [Reichenbachiella agariperforans]MBU2914267.1 hypothetical protein [Reichenbachiella agariperforans]
MRLSSLARKIKITPNQLADFLSERSIDTPQGTNSKLTDETIELVQEAFDYQEPEEAPITEEEPVLEESPVDTTETIILEEAVAPETDSSTVNEVEIELEDEILPTETVPEAEEIPDEIDEPTTGVEVEEIQAKEAIDEPDTQPEEAIGPITEESVSPEPEPEYQPIEAEDGTLIEARAELLALDKSVKIIKAPKAQTLQGLTIKGKIDLPQPKTPEQKAQEKKEKESKPLDPNAIVYTSGPKRERTQKHNPRRNKKSHKPNPVNKVEAERRRKEKEEQRKKARQLRQEKEAKKQYYQSQVKTSPTNTPAKKKAKIKKHKPEKVEGNALQKFWKWLNT